MKFTREQVIEMAIDADIIDFRDEADDPHVKQMVDMLMHVVGKAAAAEREECAKACATIDVFADFEPSDVIAECQSAIRARGSK